MHIPHASYLGRSLQPYLSIAPEHGRVERLIQRVLGRV